MNATYPFNLHVHVIPVTFKIEFVHTQYNCSELGVSRICNLIELICQKVFSLKTVINVNQKRPR